MSRGLPYGKGYIEDPVAQDTEWGRQLREKPKADGWYYGSTNVAHSIPFSNNSQPSQGGVYLIPLEIPDRDYQLQHARVRVSSGGNGCTLKCCFYVLNNDRLVQVLGSYVEFDGDSSSTRSSTNAPNCTILAGERYFFGFYNEVVTSSGTMVCSTTNTACPHGKVSTMTNLDPIIPLEVISADDTVTIPAVIYRSFQAENWTS